MKATIVIPTYWRGPVSEAPLCKVQSDYLYDHATPLDTEGTLARALASLEILSTRHEFAVAVIATSTRQEMKQAVELKVRSILAEFDYHFPIFLIGPDELVLWRRRLADKGLGEYDHFFSLEGYSNIRNMSLLAAVLTEAEAAVFFDDDQVYEDPGYLDKALEFLGGEHEGKFVGGVAGYYRQPWDGYSLPEPEREWQRIWGAIEAMNKAFEIIDRPPRLKKTPFAFGGNMVIHRDLFEKIPFDPLIPRGEDIDYLMNCKLLGHDFLLDNELWIRHLPPPRCAPDWMQIRQDIIRFSRERAKLEYQAAGDGADVVTARAFDPYPGRFLRDNLHDLVFAASMQMAGEYIAAGREKDARECIINVAISKAERRSNADSWAGYLAYQRKWQEFVAAVPTMGIWSPPARMD